MRSFEVIIIIISMAKSLASFSHFMHENISQNNLCLHEEAKKKPSHFAFESAFL